MLRSSIAKQKHSQPVNVVCDGSPSRIRRVLLISLGITILPKSSTLLTMPVAFILSISFYRYLVGVDAYIDPRVDVGIRPYIYNCWIALVGTSLLRCPRTPEDGCPYNNFTNYAVSICKRQEIIPQDLLFTFNQCNTMNEL